MNDIVWMKCGKRILIKFNHHGNVYATNVSELQKPKTWYSY